MATTAVTVDEIQKNLRMLLGVNRDVDFDDLPTALQEDLNRVWRSGRRKFLAANDWMFLQTLYTFVTPADYDTGTITVASGVVTLVGGTFPADADDYMFMPGTTGGVYRVASRDGATQITLEDTSLTITDAELFTLTRNRFDLPSNFGGFVTPLTIENSQYDELTELPVLPEFTLRAVGGRSTPVTGRPEAFSLFQRVDDETGVFTPYLEVYPLPDQQYTVTGRVRIEPGDSLAEAGTICHPMFSELLQEAVLSAGEQMYMSGGQNIHTSNFASWLPRFIERDRKMRGVKQLPPRNRRRNRRDPLWDLRTASVTWEE